MSRKSTYASPRERKRRGLQKSLSALTNIKNKTKEDYELINEIKSEINKTKTISKR